MLQINILNDYELICQAGRITSRFWTISIYLTRVKADIKPDDFLKSNQNKVKQ